MSAAKKTLVIRNGTPIDGSGKTVRAQRRHRGRGQSHQERRRVAARHAPRRPQDRRRNDAAGKWIMPGLIDAHCHMSYGYPLIKGEGKARARRGRNSRR